MPVRVILGKEKVNQTSIQKLKVGKVPYITVKRNAKKMQTLHCKFAVIDDACVYGSMNFTMAAKSQYNFMEHSRDKVHVLAFAQHFDALWEKFSGRK